MEIDLFYIGNDYLEKYYFKNLLIEIKIWNT